MNLWNQSFSVNEVKTPRDIIVEQCNELQKMTNGVVLGIVSDYTGDFDERSTSKVLIHSSLRPSIKQKLGHAGESAWFTYEFSISSRGTPKYKYVVFVIRYNITMYPAKMAVETSIINELGIESTFVTCNNETEFINLLESILNSQTMSSIINNLLSICMQKK